MSEGKKKKMLKRFTVKFLLIRNMPLFSIDMAQ